MGIVFSHNYQQKLKRFTMPVEDATTRIEVIIFSIATYLNRGSQARGITEAGRGGAQSDLPPNVSLCEVITFRSRLQPC